MIWHKFDATDESTWPPLSTDVLVVRKVWNGRIIRRGYLSACYKRAFYIEGDIIPVGEITHWTPMPELPVVEGYENELDLIRKIKESVETINAMYEGGKCDMYCAVDIYSQIIELESAWKLPLNIVDIYKNPMLPFGTVMLCAHGKGPAYAV